MASASTPMNEMKGLSLTNSCKTSELMEPKFHTVFGCGNECGSEHGSTSCCIVGSESAVAMSKCGKCASDSKMEQFESCKKHWSEVSELATNHDVGAAEIENKEVFKMLQMHSIAPQFFRTFGYDLGVGGRQSSGELKIGEKFAKGGQAKLFHVKVNWKNPKGNEVDLREGREWVLKVFKKGTLLRHLQSQWPQGYLQYRAKEYERSKLGKPVLIRYHCNVMYATLLKDGRFAFLMIKEDKDLRSIIDNIMQRNIGKNQGPFENKEEDAEMFMYRIALGMDWMHNHNIILRDLKASNVLISRRGKAFGELGALIADFECSIGVVGTGFWRAPEVLQACKEMNVSQRLELFTPQADIYSYGMTCYEILTGRYPFDDHSLRDYDLVLDGNRPEVPKFVEDWARELLKWCWQTNPLERPLVKDILKILEDNSKRVRQFKGVLEANK